MRIRFRLGQQVFVVFRVSWLRDRRLEKAFTMRARRIACTRAAIVCAVVLLTSTVAADEVKVVTSGAFTAALLDLLPEFQAQTHHTVTTAFGGSMGSAPDTIPNR